jgi:tripeptide aminopeptidase
VDSAQMHYIIRDFDRKAFEARKRKMMEIAKKVGKGHHPDCYIELIIEDSYNMREKGDGASAYRYRPAGDARLRY